MRPSDIKKIAPSIEGFFRNVNLILNFDAAWYSQVYPDVSSYRLSPLMHFVRYGLEQGRRPSPWFDVSLLPRRPDVEFVAESSLPRQLETAACADEVYLKDLANCEELWIFFNVATATELSGGMLSINRFVELALSSTCRGSKTAVAVSGVPVARAAVEYKLFKQTLPMVHLAWLVKNCDPFKVKAFLPEVFSVQFLQDVLGCIQYRSWFKSRAQLELIILNQNNELLPAPEQLSFLVRSITEQGKIAAAHTRYCTEALAVKYGLPVKLLTPLLPEIGLNTAKDRKPIFMFSPDALVDPKRQMSAATFMREVGNLLPDFEIIVISGMTVDEYLSIASQAMFSVTFGEGMDGYFIEPILSGGISFAVYNNVFFPENFECSPTVADDWSSLLDMIKRDVPKYIADSQLYDNTSRHLRTLLGQHYSRSISQSNFDDLVSGEIDFAPKPNAMVIEQFRNIRDYLELERGFRFHGDNFAVKKVVSTPDGLLVEHLGGEFYSVLYEIYERRDYDFVLCEQTDYVLLDIGANVGMASLYLSQRFRNISRIYAFEPLGFVADIARRNFAANKGLAPVLLKQIGLSDRYDTTVMDYYPDWTTAFSTEDGKLDDFLRFSDKGSRLAAISAEIEVAPAASEVLEILRLNHPKRLVIKCDTQGSEFAIFRNLDREGILDFVDAIVVETHFEEPSEVISILERAGFFVTARCDSEANLVYTVKASRISVPK